MAVWFLSLLVSCASRPVKACDDRLALRFVPKALVEESARDGGTVEVQCVMSRVDLAGKGRAEFTAIAYSNGDQGGFVVIRDSGDSATTAFSLSQAGMHGDLSPELEILDLDGDQVPEMVVSYMGRAGVSSMWVFRSRGEHVRSITPLDPNDDEVSLLENAIFVDFDGDGRKDAISRERLAAPMGDVNPLIKYHVYKMLDGSFDTVPRPLLFAGLFICGKQESIAVEERFTFDGADARRSLRLVNGASGVAVRNATLKLNGVVLVSPIDFGTKRSRLDAPIPIRSGENKISGEVLGRSGSDIAVFIY